MKTIEQVHKQIQAALRVARQTHEYRAEGASIEFTNAMVTRMRQTGVSRSELARKIKANPAYVSKILRGDTNFTLDTMVKIAGALDSELHCDLRQNGVKSRGLDAYLRRTKNGARRKKLKDVRTGRREKAATRGARKIKLAATG
jgi:transcriptional regulator with XRE-family HTH domain